MKFPAVPENSVPGSTLEAPSCGGKSQDRGMTGRLLLARPVRHGGSFDTLTFTKFAEL